MCVFLQALRSEVFAQRLACSLSEPAERWPQRKISLRLWTKLLRHTPSLALHLDTWPITSECLISPSMTYSAKHTLYIHQLVALNFHLTVCAWFINTDQEDWFKQSFEIRMSFQDGSFNTIHIMKFWKWN